MIYTYNLVLHNATNISIEKACSLADKIQNHISSGGTHVQSISVKRCDVSITIESEFQLSDLFSLIYDNRPDLGYKDFSVYYSEKYSKPTEDG